MEINDIVKERLNNSEVEIVLAAKSLIRYFLLSLILLFPVIKNTLETLHVKSSIKALFLLKLWTINAANYDESPFKMQVYKACLQIFL